MNNIQAVGALLRAVEANTGSLLAPTPIPVVNPVPAVKPVNAEGTGEQPTYEPAPERDAQVAREPRNAGARTTPAQFETAADGAEAKVPAEASGDTAPSGSPAQDVARAVTLRTSAVAAQAHSAQLPSSTPSGASLQLSSAAQLVRTLLQMPASAGGALATRSPRPLLDAPPAAADLAHAFSRAVAQSGLFYESHLAAWAAQTYPIADLQREPQAQWLNGRAENAADAAQNPAPDDATTRARPSLEAPLPDSALPLLRQQLETLETRQVLWQGDVWPQQHARLEIADEEPRGTAKTLAATWRAQLDIVLPSLGAVRAKFSLSGHALQLVMSVADPQSVVALRAAREPLLGALAAQAIDVTQLVVRHEPVS